MDTFTSNQQYNLTPEPFVSNGKIICEGYDLTSNATLDYINKMLLEEDIDKNCCIYEDDAALHATEKAFYDILGQKYPLLPDKSPLLSPDNSENSGDSNSENSGYNSNSSCENSGDGSNQSGSIDICPTNKLNHTCAAVPVNMFASQFNKGFEEALKFVPNFDKLFISSESTGAPTSLKSQKTVHLSDNKTKDSDYGVRKKSNNDFELDVIEGKAQKQKAVSSCDLVRNEKMDKALLFRGKKYIEDVTTIREIFEKEMKDESKKFHLENLNTMMALAGSKKQLDKGLVDPTLLLMSCAQAVYSYDYITANEQIKQLKEYSSHTGDLSQRLAFYFVNGLQGSLAGIGNEMYRKLVSEHTAFSDILKAYRFFLAACPFKRASYYFSNQMILNALKNESQIHVIDFAILFGFQWPSFFERFSNWKGQPPAIRITGVDKPQPGFRPFERLSDTGRRLTDYAQSFKIPFEYKGIASSNWENISTEDIDVHENDLLVVNCICPEIISDGTTITDIRDSLLNTVKKLNPHIVILGVVTSSFVGSYFVSRFKETLYHYSSLFDMLDTTMPRDNPERISIEKNLGKNILNAVACEGSERVEGMERYKNWQSRIASVGYVQLPLHRSILKTIKDVVKSLYHKEFVVDEDDGWLVMGWKGRILFAMSSWKPS